MAAIVTAGARGIGRACAEALRAARHDVGIIDLVAPTADDALPDGVEVAIAGVGDHDGIGGAFDDLIGRIGEPAVLVCAAGIEPRARPRERGSGIHDRDRDPRRRVLLPQRDLARQQGSEPMIDVMKAEAT